MTNVTLSGLRLVTHHEPSRLHSLCYLFREDDGQRSLVWRESDKQRGGLYDLRHYIVVIDPDQVPDVSDIRTLLTLARSGKRDVKPETVMDDGSFQRASDCIRSWDARMARNQFTVATVGEPRFFSHHPTDADDNNGANDFGGGTRQRMMNSGWLAVAR